MESTTAQKVHTKSGGISIASSRPLPTPQPRSITWKEFSRRYLQREDGHTYEWVNGLVQKTTNTMNPTQLYIQRNLQEIFIRLRIAGKITGQLLAEPDLFLFPEIHRRPDFAWLTDQQIDRLAEPGTIEIPAFVIEVISNNDAAIRLVEKMRNYRKAGVQIVWLIYPSEQEVNVYSGASLENMIVRSGDQVCSATVPTLLAFECTVNEIFRKTTAP
jgi:Uma2 family endonuclease